MPADVVVTDDRGGCAQCRDRHEARRRDKASKKFARGHALHSSSCWFDRLGSNSRRNNGYESKFLSDGVPPTESIGAAGILIQTRNRPSDEPLFGNNSTPAAD